MKRAAVIFIILFLSTLLVPMISIARNKQSKDTQELVTIFSSSVSPEWNYHSPFQPQREQ